MTGMEFGIWSGVTGILMLLSTLFGMRIEVRGASGIAQDVKDLVSKIKADVEDVKAKLHNEQPVAQVKASV